MDSKELQESFQFSDHVALSTKGAAGVWPISYEDGFPTMLLFVKRGCWSLADLVFRPCFSFPTTSRGFEEVMKEGPLKCVVKRQNTTTTTTTTTNCYYYYYYYYY